MTAYNFFQIFLFPNSFENKGLNKTAPFCSAEIALFFSILSNFLATKGDLDA